METTPASSLPCPREFLEDCTSWQWVMVSEMLCGDLASLPLPVMPGFTGLASPKGSLAAGGSTVVPLPPTGVTMMPVWVP